MRKFIITSILEGFDQKIRFSEWWYRFSFNNLGLAVIMVFKLCASVEKMLKLQLGKLWGLLLTFGELAGEKLAGSFFDRQPPHLHPEYC